MFAHTAPEDNLATDDRWIASKRPERVKSLTLASPGFRVEDPEVCASLEEIRKVLLVNKPGNGGDDSGTLPEEPLAEICAYFIGALPRLKSARQAMSDRFQKRCALLLPRSSARMSILTRFIRTLLPQMAQTTLCTRLTPHTTS